MATVFLPLIHCPLQTKHPISPLSVVITSYHQLSLVSPSTLIIISLFIPDIHHITYPIVDPSPIIIIIIIDIVRKTTIVYFAHIPSPPSCSLLFSVFISFLRCLRFSLCVCMYVCYPSLSALFFLLVCVILLLISSSIIHLVLAFSSYPNIHPPFRIVPVCLPFRTSTERGLNYFFLSLGFFFVVSPSLVNFHFLLLPSLFLFSSFLPFLTSLPPHSPFFFLFSFSLLILPTFFPALPLSTLTIKLPLPFTSFSLSSFLRSRI